MSHDHNGRTPPSFGEGGEPTDLQLGEFIDSAVHEGKAYYNAQKEYLTLRLSEKVGRAAGNAVGLLLSAVMLAMFLLFASLALAFWLSALLESTALGFIAVGGIYLLGFLIIHFIARDAIRASFVLNLINSFYDDKD